MLSYVLHFALAFSAFYTDLLPKLGTWRAGRIMHEVLLAAVMHLPLQFFDTTPVGRVLARFSKDTDVLDESLPFQISDTIYCIFEVIAAGLLLSHCFPVNCWGFNIFCYYL